MSKKLRAADRFDAAIASGDFHAAIETLKALRVGDGNSLEPALNAEQISLILSAASPAQALYLFGTAVWSMDGYELLGLKILIDAAAHGSEAAVSAVGEGLSWLGMPEHAIEWLERAWDAASDRKTWIGGLLGESLQATDQHDERVLALLERAAEEDDSFGVSFAIELCEFGELEQARSCLEGLTERGVYGAAIKLGNLLVDELDDPVGAERAYRAGVRQGDGHSAYNLGVLLQKQGRRSEADDAFREALQLGDYTEPPADDAQPEEACN